MPALNIYRKRTEQIIGGHKGGIIEALGIQGRVVIQVVDTLPNGILGGYVWANGRHYVYLVPGGNVVQRLAHELRHAHQWERANGTKGLGTKGQTGQNQGKKADFAGLSHDEAERDAEQWAITYIQRAAA